MTTTTTVNEQTQTRYEETDRLILSPPLEDTSRGGIFGRWGRRVSTASSVGPFIVPLAVHPLKNSTTNVPCENPCERCEDLKTQSDINRKMLDDCATDLKIKEAEVDAVKGMVEKLQALLDQANVELRLKQARLERELAKKDKQLAEQITATQLHIDTSSELVAQLTKLHKEHNETHDHEKQQVDTVKASYEQELEAKDQEISCLRGKLKELEVAENKAKAETNSKITQLEDDLCCLKQDIEGEATKRAAEQQFNFEKRVYDDLKTCRARIVDLEAENEKLYAQLSIEDDLIADESSDEEDNGDGIPL